MPANEWFHFAVMLLMVSGLGFLFLFWIRRAVSWRPNYLILGIGIGVLCLSSLLYVNTYGLLRSAVETQGTVVDFSREADISSGDFYVVPLVEFQTHEGDRIRFKEPGSFGFRVRVGDRVGVLYNPQNPSEARIRSWSSLWGWSLITLVIGASVLGIAVWDYIRNVSVHRRNP